MTLVVALCHCYTSESCPLEVDETGKMWVSMLYLAGKKLDSSGIMNDNFVMQFFIQITRF